MGMLQAAAGMAAACMVAAVMPPAEAVAMRAQLVAVVAVVRAHASGGDTARTSVARTFTCHTFTCHKFPRPRATSSRTNRSTTVHAPANNAVGKTTPLNATGNATRNATEP